MCFNYYYYFRTRRTPRVVDTRLCGETDRPPGRMPAMITEASGGRRSCVHSPTIVPVTNS